MPTTAANQKYRIVPIRTDFLRRARASGLDDQNQPVERSVATGGEPCRDVLRPALPGEEIILASYCPFKISGPYKEYGPVFILATDTEETVDLSSLPTTGKHSYFSRLFVLRGYSSDERIVDSVLTSLDDAEDRLDKLFMRSDVDFVLARFGAYGCYGCRIERV
jgi:hypothetical protein